MSTIEYLAIGHVTHDILSDDQHTVGGTVSYATRTAAALGQSVGALTSAGPDFDKASLNPFANVTWIPAIQTTTFKNTYTVAGRQQILYGTAQPLQYKHIPPQWHDVPIVHLGPLVAECDMDIVTHFAGQAFVGVTPQGWLRTCDATGHIIPTTWETAAQILPLTSAVILSIEDVGGDLAQLQAFAQQAAILVVTQGYKGGTLFINGKPQTFPAIAVDEVDPTGAGDIFATAFFIALAAQNPPLVAANFAACLSGYSVTRRGLDSTPRADEVQLCSQILSNG